MAAEANCRGTVRFSGKWRNKADMKGGRCGVTLLLNMKKIVVQKHIDCIASFKDNYITIVVNDLPINKKPSAQKKIS